jgi:hypothetical protein
MASYKTPLLYLAKLSIWPGLAAAVDLPWGEITPPLLKETDRVSFDPLSLLAVLWNPRATASASRLYAQPDRHLFRWPHMMQIGAVLVPVSMLVSHFTRDYNSLHPAVDMYLASVRRLEVKSTIGRSLNLFPTLPICASDSMITDYLNFKPSKIPANDIMVVNLISLAGMSTGTSQSPGITLTWRHHVFKAIIIATEVVMVSVMSISLALSIVSGDIWGIVLFGTFWLHLAASTAVSFCQLIITEARGIQPDNSIVFALYQRPSGGIIIFRGHQDTLEQWARTTWKFKRTALHYVLHWLWIITGTAAALASVACMVNMTGRFQLAFLGTLIYASVGELWLTVVAHRLQTASFATFGSATSQSILLQDKRYKSIIHAALGLDDEHRIDVSSWIDLSLLPRIPIFEAMLDTLDYLNKQTTPQQDTLSDAKQIFDTAAGVTDVKDLETRNGIWNEIRTTWSRRTGFK